MKKVIAFCIIIVIMILFIFSIETEKSDLYEPTTNPTNISTPINTLGPVTEPVILETTSPIVLYVPVVEEFLKNSPEYIAGLSVDDISQQRIKIDNFISDLFALIASFDFLAFDYVEACEMAMKDIKRLQDLNKQYADEYFVIMSTEEERIKWEARRAEYPVATEVWLYLVDEMGYNKYVAAGILGNMMAECGGQTLKLNWTAVNKSSGCYGLCQWHPKYHKEVQGADLQGQLQYISKSFPNVIKRYAYLYKSNFTYEDFLALQDPGEAAYAFCIIYERPGPGSYEKRRENAMKAFQYFAT